MADFGAERTPTVEALAATPTAIEAAIAGVSASNLERVSQSEDWSIAQIIGHVLAADAILMSRIPQILTRPGVSLVSFDANRHNPGAHFHVDWLRESESSAADRVVDERWHVVFTTRRQCVLGFDRLCGWRAGTIAHLVDTQVGSPREFVLHDDRTNEVIVYGPLAGSE